MKKTFAVLLCCFLASVGRAQDQTNHLASRANKAPGSPGYMEVKDNDKAMDGAVDHAQKSLGFFIAALAKKRSGDERFEIKKGFVDGDVVEHLWIDHLVWDGQKFRGRINNEPADVKNVHLGQSVVVNPRDVSDWMFVKDGKLMGGYTTRVLYGRLSPQQKAAFDQEAQFTIQ